MIRTEFLEKLSETAREWRLTASNKILFGQSTIVCPIEKVYADESGEEMSYFSAARFLGLSDKDRISIVDAADNVVDSLYFDPQLRQELLKATGLA